MCLGRCEVWAGRPDWKVRELPILWEGVLRILRPAVPFLRRQRTAGNEPAEPRATRWRVPRRTRPAPSRQEAGAQRSRTISIAGRHAGRIRYVRTPAREVRVGQGA